MAAVEKRAEQRVSEQKDRGITALANEIKENAETVQEDVRQVVSRTLRRTAESILENDQMTKVMKMHVEWENGFDSFLDGMEDVRNKVSHSKAWEGVRGGMGTTKMGMWTVTEMMSTKIEIKMVVSRVDRALLPRLRAMNDNPM